ncbi:MAG: NAD(P)H-binding protein [Polyangiaceae bacterium]
MHSVVITGATGVVGSRALSQLLDRSDVAHVTALGRRTLSITHPKLESKVVDLQSVDALAAAIPEGVTLAVCCLGTTMKQAGSKEAFRAVDHDAVVAFGAAAHKRGAKRFVLVSSVGADPTAGSFYLKTKGEAEEALARLGFAQLTVLRPSFLDDEGARTENRIGERIALPLARAVFAVVGKTRRYAPITIDTVAKALVHVAFDATTDARRTIESEQLHALGA